MPGKNRVLVSIALMMVLLMPNTSYGENFSPDTKISANMAVTTSYPISGYGMQEEPEVTTTVAPAEEQIEATATANSLITAKKTASPIATPEVTLTPPMAKTAGFEGILVILTLTLCGIYMIGRKKT